MLIMVAGCSRQPVSSPYQRGFVHDNVLNAAVSQRSPLFLDAASSYSTDETPFTYSIYEPLYSYHYLERPYQLVPRCRTYCRPVYLDADGGCCPTMPLAKR